MGTNRVELDDNTLEAINGGSLRMAQHKDGSFTITGNHTGQTLTLPKSAFYDVITLCGKQPDNLEGEKIIFEQLSKL